eukprot:SAG31_NODE_320_length_17748_cov_4.201881_8_plen_71_part_00
MVRGGVLQQVLTHGIRLQIAIVLSVLLGIVGYIMQALTARRSEQQAAERAQESHLAERKRDREHVSIDLS